MRIINIDTRGYVILPPTEKLILDMYKYGFLDIMAVTNAAGLAALVKIGLANKSSDGTCTTLTPHGQLAAEYLSKVDQVFMKALEAYTSINGYRYLIDNTETYLVSVTPFPDVQIGDIRVVTPLNHPPHVRSRLFLLSDTGWSFDPVELTVPQTRAFKAMRKRLFPRVEMDETVHYVRLVEPASVQHN